HREPEVLHDVGRLRVFEQRRREEGSKRPAVLAFAVVDVIEWLLPEAPRLGVRVAVHLLERERPEPWPDTLRGEPEEPVGGPERVRTVVVVPDGELDGRGGHRCLTPNPPTRT